VTSSVAANAADNKVTTETIKDWRLVCNENKQCVANQVISVKRDDKLQNVLTLTLVKGGNGQSNLELKLPFGLDLRPGIVTRVDEADEEKFPFVTCMPDGCIAVMPMTKDRLAMFKKGSKLTVGFRPLGNEKTVAVEASLSGFTAAQSKI
jgi:invasion protein IalB